jgi:heme/copper-type cytochrome/quinol oxidase subunit 2
MKRNARQIFYFFLVMMAIICIRIIMFIVYEAIKFESEGGLKNQDNIVGVALINLTEISLVVTTTQSLRWSLVTYN